MCRRCARLRHPASTTWKTYIARAASRNDPHDRRASSVQLTPAGRAAFNAMAAVHEGWIEELLQDIPTEDKAQLIVLLARMKDKLNDATFR